MGVIKFDIGAKTTSGSIGISPEYSNKIMVSIKANLKIMGDTGATTTNLMQAVLDDCDPVTPQEFFLIGLFLGAALTESHP